LFCKERVGMKCRISSIGNYGDLGMSLELSKDKAVKSNESAKQRILRCFRRKRFLHL